VKPSDLTKENIKRYYGIDVSNYSWFWSVGQIIGINIENSHSITAYKLQTQLKEKFTNIFSVDKISDGSFRVFFKPLKGKDPKIESPKNNTTSTSSNFTFAPTSVGLKLSDYFNNYLYYTNKTLIPDYNDKVTLDTEHKFDILKIYNELFNK